MTNDSTKNLEGWIKEPTIQNAVIAWLDNNPGVHTLREICDSTGFRSYAVNNALRRLAKKGVVAEGVGQRTWVYKHHITGQTISKVFPCSTYRLVDVE